MGNVKTMKHRNPQALFYHNSCYAMGSRLNVVLADSTPDGDGLFGRIVQEVNRLEAKLSRFYADSEVYHINQNAGKHPVHIDAEMATILSMCGDYCRRTRGAFDITLPSKFQALEIHQPAQRQEDNGCSCWCDSIIFDSEQQSVAFVHPSIQMDLGGFGKGYAIEKIGFILRDSGIRNALVSFGESSILALGRHPYGPCWKIALDGPGPAKPAGPVFELTNQSLSTSGFHKHKDQAMGFHIISPLTRRPVKAASTITVQSPDPVEAEILSTALFAALDTDICFLDNFHDYRMVRVDYPDHQLKEICAYERC